MSGAVGGTFALTGAVGVAFLSRLFTRRDRRETLTAQFLAECVMFETQTVKQRSMLENNLLTLPTADDHLLELMGSLARTGHELALGSPRARPLIHRVLVLHRDLLIGTVPALSDERERRATADEYEGLLGQLRAYFEK